MERPLSQALRCEEAIFSLMETTSSFSCLMKVDGKAGLFDDESR
jgi:hypothetical protein